MAKKIILALLVIPVLLIGCCLLIQLLPFGRDHNNPPVVKEPNWDSSQTAHWRNEPVLTATVMRLYGRGIQISRLFHGWFRTMCVKEEKSSIFRIGGGSKKLMKLGK